ncbi:MAG: glycosyltransferase family 4 protein [Thermodesulfobacteriota bacterium]
MRVAQIATPWIPIPPVTYGGTELMVADLCRGLINRGVAVVLFAARDSTLPVPCFGPFPEALWPPEKFSENLHLSYAFAHLKSDPVRIIHSHLENAAGFWNLGFSGTPLVITLHTPLTPIKCRYLLSFPQVQVVALSNFQYRQLAGHPHLHLIPHGLDLAAYPFKAAKEGFLLFLGRIYADKGLHTAIRLAQEQGEKLLIAGPVWGPDQDYFDQAIRPHLNQDTIIYLGPADFPRKVDLLGRAKALVLPLEVDEAFGLVMLEAMACGTPVLAYDRGAVPEVVRHGETGLVVHTYDQLRESLSYLKELNPELCRRHVEQHFSLEHMVTNYLNLYRALG